MPNCKKCGEHFPNNLIVDGKRRNLCRRLYCLVCSPFGQHNTRKIHVPGFADKPIRICDKCGNDYLGGHHKHKSICDSCRVTICRQNIKKKAIDFLGGKCIICGYNRCERALHFHHVNPKEKEFMISRYSRNWERVIEELKKCVLLCSNCHAEVESGLIEIDFPEISKIMQCN